MHCLLTYVILSCVQNIQNVTVITFKKKYYSTPRKRPLSFQAHLSFSLPTITFHPWKFMEMAWLAMRSCLNPAANPIIRTLRVVTPLGKHPWSATPKTRVIYPHVEVISNFSARDQAWRMLSMGVNNFNVYLNISH